MAEHRWNRELETKIIAHAWKDENFRDKLLKNPKEAFKEHGVELPRDTEIKVWQEDANHFYFVLPRAPAEVRKLSPAELEKLAAAAGTINQCSDAAGPC